MTDKEKLNRLGGINEVAKHLGFSYQRVANWAKRGIPPQVKLDYPELFQSNNPPNLKNAQTKTPKP